MTKADYLSIFPWLHDRRISFITSCHQSFFFFVLGVIEDYHGHQNIYLEYAWNDGRKEKMNKDGGRDTYLSVI